MYSMCVSEFQRYGSKAAAVRETVNPGHQSHQHTAWGEIPHPSTSHCRTSSTTHRVSSALLFFSLEWVACPFSSVILQSLNYLPWWCFSLTILMLTDSEFLYVGFLFRLTSYNVTNCVLNTCINAKWEWESEREYWKGKWEGPSSRNVVLDQLVPDIPHCLRMTECPRTKHKSGMSQRTTHMLIKQFTTVAMKKKSSQMSFKFVYSHVLPKHWFGLKLSMK